MYVALSQHYRESVVVVARTKGDPRLWIEPLNQAVKGLGIFLPFRPVTFDTWTNFTLLEERITAAAVAGLSALGMLLAVVGLFGAISYSVSERKKELGIRVALGARPGQLLEMVLRQTLAITGVGTAIGILLGVGATVLLRSQFYGVSAVEWTVLVPVAAAMLACLGAGRLPVCAILDHHRSDGSGASRLKLCSEDCSSWWSRFWRPGRSSRCNASEPPWSSPAVSKASSITSPSARK